MNITIKSRDLAKHINKNVNRSIIDKNIKIIRDLSQSNENKPK
jgi:hypothetical protein